MFNVEVLIIKFLIFLFLEFNYMWQIQFLYLTICIILKKKGSTNTKIPFSINQSDVYAFGVAAYYLFAIVFLLLTHLSHDGSSLSKIFDLTMSLTGSNILISHSVYGSSFLAWKTWQVNSAHLPGLPRPRPPTSHLLPEL